MQQDNPRESDRVVETKQRVLEFTHRFLGRLEAPEAPETPVETHVHPVENPQMVYSELHLKKDHELVVRSMVGSVFLDATYYDFSSGTSMSLFGNMSLDLLAELVNRVIDEHSE